MALLWFDGEMTGLRPSTDHFLEVAWTLTEDSLNPVEGVEGIRSYVVTPLTRTFQFLTSNSFVFDMHTKNGLVKELQEEGTLMLSDIEDVILADLAKLNGNEPVTLAGASVHFDKQFIETWMPRLAHRLHYRVYDTSTLRAFFEQIGIDSGVIAQESHRAAQDVEEVLSMAREYRRRVHSLLSGQSN